MKKGKSRNKRKKTRSRLLWIAIAVIGIAAVISAVCMIIIIGEKKSQKEEIQWLSRGQDYNILRF